MEPIANDLVAFREVQRFWDTMWFRAMGIGLCVLLVGLGVWAMVQQLCFHIPWGNHPAPDGGLAVIATVMMIIGVFTLWLYYFMRLETEVRSDGLYVRFFPFHLKPQRIGFDELAKCEAVTYRPLIEYGGWGIRYGLSGKAYNVRGKRGVRLEFTKGGKLLIGSQDPEALAKALTSRAPQLRDGGR
jgi:hypothetical protein